ncbi:MAG TPA: GNAT family N-acetyltransferase [Actinomycetota bacterium]
MDLEFRPISPEEFRAYYLAIESAFGHIPTDEEIEIERVLAELDRSTAVFDGSDIVGSAAAYTLELTVPGGMLPMAGVTGVAVVPTHRRRGILTELMRRQLVDVHDREEPLAGLWASEGSIYQRFGYGPGTLQARFTIERTRTAFARPLPPDPGQVRMVDRDQAMAAMPAAYERIRPEIPGMVSRSGAWWTPLFSDTEHERDGASPLFFVLHEAEGRTDGYAAYRVKGGWENGAPTGQARVHELMAANPAAYGALWRFVLNLDLVATVSTWRRPADEPLLFMLAEPRRLRLGLSDALWLRLIDVPAALAARSYAGEGRLVLEVRDELCPWNEGRRELVAGPDGGDCRPTRDEPDLWVDVADLAAVYLGGTTFERLRWAGRLSASSDEAVRRADGLFRTPRAPWCPNVF